MKIDRHLLRNLDWTIFSVSIFISLIGILTIYSATRPPIEEAHPTFYLKQSIWLIIGVLFALLFASFDYIWLGRLSGVIYVVGLFLLAVVLLVGKVGMGAQRWLNIGPVSFQPSEIFKLIFIIVISGHLAMRNTPFTMGGILKLFFLVFLLPFLLILKQPDLGTGIVLMMIFLSLVLSKGIKRKAMLFVLLLGLISIPFIGNIFWNGLKDYQRNRLIAFMEPEADPKGIGYQIIQSKVAVGSGMLFGKGYLRGTQGPLRFLPEKHTDFIFSSFAEEWGFAGCLIVLCAYLFLILRALNIAKNSKDSFGRYLAMGVAFMFTIYSTVNLAMILGLMPIVGVPLPFMSYGGTALIINFMAVGILMGIRARRFYLFY